MSARECELTIGTTRWRMTTDDVTFTVSRLEADGEWKELASGNGGTGGMRDWARADFLHEVAEGLAFVLERFAEVMAVQ